MQEFKEIYKWFSPLKEILHAIPCASSLPSPTFIIDGREYISFSTNNYLGLASHPRMINKAREGLEKYGVANCESRLLGGDMDLYLNLEAKIAQLKHKESAMLFATGYLTNLGVLSALVNTGKLARFFGHTPSKIYKYTYFTDQYNHVSICEGIALSGIHSIKYRHCDMNDLEQKLKTYNDNIPIIVSDGVFSMDGDIVPLPDMLQLAERYGAMIYIDDAHGTGILGKTGAGTTEHFDIDSPCIISMGTLSKAYGAIGGFIAADSCITEALRFSCKSYGFTSTLPPDQAYAVSEAIDIVHDEPELRQQIWENQRYFVAGVEALGYRVMSKECCIIPVEIGDETQCESMARILGNDYSIHVDSIVFPAVPQKQARLRFSMNAKHTRDHLDRALDALKQFSANVNYEYKQRSLKKNSA